MKKKAFLLVLFPILGLAQKNKAEHPFTVIQIDSIAEKYGRELITDGRINVTEKDNKFTGVGGFSYQTYVYNPDLDKWKELPSAEKRKFNLKKNQTLIKGKYHQVTHFEGSSKNNSEEITAEFYYNTNKLFFVKITERTYKAEEELNSYTYLVKYSDVTSCTLAPELSKWIEEHNTAILNYYKRD